MTRAPISPAISAVRSLLESTTRTSASGTAARMSAITLPTAFSSLRVIIATVRFSRLRSVDIRRLFLLNTGWKPALRQDPRALVVEAEAQLGQPLGRQGPAQARGVVG